MIEKGIFFRAVTLLVRFSIKMPLYDRKSAPANPSERFTLIGCLIAHVPYRVLFNMVSFIISLLYCQRSEPMKSTLIVTLIFSHPDTIVIIIKWNANSSQQNVHLDVSTNVLTAADFIIINLKSTCAACKVHE